MKPYFVFLCLVMPCVAFCQKENLYYFSGKDKMTFGVKSSSGSIILPAAFYLYTNEDGDKIEGSEITLWDTGRAGADSMGYNYRVKIFNRQGKFLYSPFWFDNGLDYYVAGLRRFVEHGKMGFVAKGGRRVIPAKYNFVSPFYKGYAVACLDCVYARVSNDEEHCCAYKGSKYAIINRKGVVVFHSKTNIELDDSVLVRLKLKH